MYFSLYTNLLNLNEAKLSVILVERSETQSCSALPRASSYVKTNNVRTSADSFSHHSHEFRSEGEDQSIDQCSP